jgi:hypothetical protein
MREEPARGGAAVEVSGVAKRYSTGGQIVVALEDVNVSMDAGAFVGIAGPVRLRQVDASPCDRSRFLFSELRNRPLRAGTLALGILAAAVSFVLLTGPAATSAIQVRSSATSVNEPAISKSARTTSSSRIPIASASGPASAERRGRKATLASQS